MDDPAQDLLRPLDHRARQVLGLFVQSAIQSKDVANLLEPLNTAGARTARTVAGWLCWTPPAGAQIWIG